MPTKPICLIQWLKANDKFRETQAALACFADSVNIYHADVLTKEQAEMALQTWFRDSAGNTQYCFIGAHGIEDPPGTAIGIGASVKAAEFANWQELWNWFARGNLKGGLWLGACMSSDAAVALSPFVENDHPAIPHIYGFSDKIYPPEIMLILLKLIAFTDPNNFPYLDEEIGLLRAAVPTTKVELFDPEITKSGSWEYMNVDDMPKKINMRFRQLLESKRSGQSDKS
ncbi:MAG: hypothetical protein WBC78_02750 [Candidatus Sulfotelmatobacter sp.]